LSCPGGVVAVSGAATAGVVATVVVVGASFPCPAQGGFPFSTRVFCFVAPAFHVLSVGELQRPLFAGVAVAGVVVRGVVTGVVTGWVTGCGAGVGTTFVGGGVVRCRTGGAAGRDVRRGAVTRAIAVEVGRGASSCFFA
jgi:hypothetical protein